MAHLHIYSSAVPVENRTDEDVRTREYIDKYHTRSYDEYMSDERGLQTFYNLTDMSVGAISWYPFRCAEPGGVSPKALVIGAGYGTYAGFLCERGYDVTATEMRLFRAESICARYEEHDNLKVYAGNIADEEFFEAIRAEALSDGSEGFDYIILPGVLCMQGDRADMKNRSPYISYLSRISSLLNSTGRILIAEDNRLGLRYLCGDLNRQTGRAFDSLKGYPQGTKGYEFTRVELLDVIDRVGLRSDRVYYPLPDYKLPQMIYSDSHLPGRDVTERLLPYHLTYDKLIAREADLYAGVIDNDSFPAFANSFIVECSRSDAPDTGEAVEYATLSYDRGKRCSFTTRIIAKNEGTHVEKSPLYSEGRESTEAIISNSEALTGRGISVVDQTVEDGSIRMPYVGLPTLSAYIRELAASSDREQIIVLLDRIYADILRSSDESETIDEAFDRYPARRSSWGIVLKKCYMELMPLNIFINAGEDRFIYFDQEFTRDNCPAGYVMYRGIKYLYCYTPGLEDILPVNEVYERYHMTDVWQYYEEEEMKFQEDIHNWNQYKLFYDLARIDGALI